MCKTPFIFTMIATSQAADYITLNQWRQLSNTGRPHLKSIDCVKVLSSEALSLRYAVTHNQVRSTVSPPREMYLCKVDFQLAN